MSENGNGSTVTREVLHGFEPHTWYIDCEWMTRGQAKAYIAWDECEAFIDLRCRRVWLSHREVTAADANEGWLPDWRPGDKAWMSCERQDAGAVAWWEVTTRAASPGRSYPSSSRSLSPTEGQT